MEKYLFIVRSPSGKGLFAMEARLKSNLISMAYELLDVVRGEFPDDICESCEIWFSESSNLMTLLCTVF